MSTRRDGGFTLLEMLIVVLIVGILAAIAIPVFLNQREKAWQTSLESDVRNIVTSMEAYLADHGQYTTDVTSLVAAGYAHNPSVTVLISLATDGRTYCAAGRHIQLGTETWYLGPGGLVANDPATACPTAAPPTFP